MAHREIDVIGKKNLQMVRNQGRSQGEGHGGMVPPEWKNKIKICSKNKKKKRIGPDSKIVGQI